jgi:hypothetical protein
MVDLIVKLCLRSKGLMDIQHHNKEGHVCTPVFVFLLCMRKYYNVLFPREKKDRERKERESASVIYARERFY